MRRLDLHEPSQVGEARRAAVAMASGLDFNEDEAARVALIATELGTNLVKHGGGGELLLGGYDDGEGAGVEIVALDRGAGFENLARSMRDGHSTTGSPGTGLGAIDRLANLMEVHSAPGRGAAVLARIQKGPRTGALRSPPIACGVVSLPLAGEESCGDGWAVRRDAQDGLVAMVVDGLGHGPLAASAAHAAIRTFHDASGAPSIAFVERLHLALKGTRGAAASLVSLPRTGPIVFIGVGNVAGVLIGGSQARRLVGYNGTLGLALRSVRAFDYAAEPQALVVLASDGLASAWSLDDYPGLRGRHPTLIAAVLYRDFGRARDDVTVLVARREAP